MLATLPGGVGCVVLMVENAFTVTTQDRQTLRGGYYETSAPPVAVLPWLHGYASHRKRYDSFARWMARHNIQVITMDVRGHGDSDGLRGYIRRFSDYFLDVEALLLYARERFPGTPVILGAHSHGALIASRYLEEREPPFPLQAAVFTGPFMGLGHPLPAWKIRAVSLIDRVYGACPLPTTVHPEWVSKDPAVVEAYSGDTKVFSRVRARWLMEVMKNHGLALEKASRIRLPLLVLQGLEDRVVSVESARRFYEAVGSSGKEWRGYEGMLHEVLNELERERVYGEIREWIASRL